MWTDDWPCFTWSAPRKLATTSMWTKDDIDMARREGQSWTDITPLPWDQRDPVPVWRGKWWWSHCDTAFMCGSRPDAATLRVAAASSVEEIIAMETEYSLADLARPREQRHGGGAVSRLVAVAYSVKYPSELNARFAGSNLMERSKIFPKDRIFANRDKNGLAALITPPLSTNASASEKAAWDPGSPIALQEYYGNYQVALVLGGIGAAFRLTSHLQHGTAVILEDYHLELWYTRFLIPWVHVIPLARYAKNLTAVLEWTRTHPCEVARIAREGQVFYEAELSPYRTVRNFEYMLSTLETWIGSNATESTCEGGMEVRAHVGFPGRTFEKLNVSTVAQCCDKCLAKTQCTHFTMRGDDCRLKRRGPPAWESGENDPGNNSTFSGRRVIGAS
jgi:hypothetical protein